jgi:hypothetical protein
LMLRRPGNVTDDQPATGRPLDSRGAGEIGLFSPTGSGGRRGGGGTEIAVAGGGSGGDGDGVHEQSAPKSASRGRQVMVDGTIGHSAGRVSNGAARGTGLTGAKRLLRRRKGFSQSA